MKKRERRKEEWKFLGIYAYSDQIYVPTKLLTMPVCCTNINLKEREKWNVRKGKEWCCRPRHLSRPWCEASGFSSSQEINVYFSFQESKLRIRQNEECGMSKQLDFKVIRTLKRVAASPLAVNRRGQRNCGFPLWHSPLQCCFFANGEMITRELFFLLPCWPLLRHHSVL